MSGERYFLETWLRAPSRPESLEALENYHPHITFVRPFTIQDGKEEDVKEKIVDYCRRRSPIPFALDGIGNFDETIDYIPVKGRELQEFDQGIEQFLASDVQFVEKLGERKVLHMTVLTVEPKPFPRAELFMLRLTCLRDNKIWFSFDFVTQEVLNRSESLDEPRWLNTCRMFAEQSD